MLERLFQEKWTENRELYSFLLGVFVPIIAAIASALVFRKLPDFQGIGTLMFAVILTIPTINKLFLTEERKEVHSRANFFHKHNHIIDSFLYLFAGTFISFLALSVFFPNVVFDAQNLLGPQIQHDTLLPEVPGFEESVQSQIIGILLNNITIVIVAFILSLIFGGGSIFLIMLNSSIFASSFLTVISSSDLSGGSQILYILCQFGILITHGIPEVLAYLIAAVAGGVLSQATIRERWMSHRFKIVLKDSVILMLIAILILVVAGFIEILISKRLYIEESCRAQGLVWLIVGILLIKALFWVEFHRQKHKRTFHKRFRPKRI